MVLMVADLCVCGILQPQCEALFDIRVVDTMHHHTVCLPVTLFHLVFSRIREEKYLKAC